MNTKKRRGPRLRSRGSGSLAVPAGILALVLLQAGCASGSVGDPVLLQETINARCPATALKECVVWGGNKFRKRYEYCGCRETR
jgi:hypothetical protein